MISRKYDLVVVGGGPAGLSAAISFMLHKRNFGKQVCIIESQDAIGKTILKTGNGRCNFTHHNLTYDNYNHPEIVMDVEQQVKNLLGFQSKDLNVSIELFKRLGLLYYKDCRGNYFPLTNKAITVRNLLLQWITYLNIDVYCNSEIINISNNEKYCIKIRSKQNSFNVKFSKLCFATGSNFQLDKFEPLLSLKVNPYKKLLCPINIKGINKSLDGVRVKCRAKLLDGCDKVLYEEEGEVLFRKYGLSGICIFNISRHFIKGSSQQISLDLLANLDQNFVAKIAENKYFILQKIHPKTTYVDIFSGFIHPLIIKSLFHDYRIKNISDIKKSIKKLSNVKFSPTSLNTSQYQVRRGGISFSEVCNNLSLKKHPNISLCGEILDIDGACGGYNLHWAWVSGLLCGSIL